MTTKALPIAALLACWAAGCGPETGPAAETPEGPLAAATTAYEAENALRSNANVMTTIAGYSGTGFVDMVNMTGSYVQFTVSSPSAGAATVVVRYMNASTADRPMDVSVNGAAPFRVSFVPVGAPNWTTWATRTFTATLRAGSNTLRLTSVTTSGGPHLDKLDVSTGGATTYTLTIAVNGAGATTPAAGTYTYDAGATVNVTATPASGSTFTGWSGAASGTASPVTVTMDGNKTLTATFSTGSNPWPQCYANGRMPENPRLTVNPGNTGYRTALTNGGNSYVAMLIGPNRQACITDAVGNFDVGDLTGEIRDVVEGLGFPAYDQWAKGYYLNWIILNSGIPGYTLSGQGGHQGVDMAGNMDFESTEECPCNWGTGNSYNRGAALHESIHALQSQLWVFNNRASGWIHEAHNCYLGTQRMHRVYNQYTIGYGIAATLQMPFVPIESMGVLTDGTIAGPADQLASGKTYVNSITRYGLEIFFLSLSQSMGPGFINCLWIQAPRNNQRSVFQILQSYGGNEAAANAVMTFAARTSLLDFGDWTTVVRNTMRSNWNTGYWFYMFPGGDGTSWFRPPTNQIPHHQGRNVIPIRLASGATSVTVEFTPDATGSLGTPENMRAQLTYRTTADQPVYGPVFTRGQSTIQVPGGARNGIVNLVVAVTNPNAASGGDDGSNKGFNGQEHFGYQARIVSGGTIAPNTVRPW